MSFFFEGNIYADASYIINSTIGTSIFTGGAISTSSLDMLSTSGNYQNITNVAAPIQPNDAAIKQTVDNLGININTVTLTQTIGTTILTSIGSYFITVTNLVMNGPSATFLVSKNASNLPGHIAQINNCPGVSQLQCVLDLSWDANSPLSLFKRTINYNGSYTVKII
jgi:hypothetical protein